MINSSRSSSALSSCASTISTRSSSCPAGSFTFHTNVHLSRSGKIDLTHRYYASPGGLSGVDSSPVSHEYEDYDTGDSHSFGSMAASSSDELAHLGGSSPDSFSSTDQDDTSTSPLSSLLDSPIPSPLFPSSASSSSFPEAETPWSPSTTPPVSSASVSPTSPSLLHSTPIPPSTTRHPYTPQVPAPRPPVGTRTVYGFVPRYPVFLPPRPSGLPLRLTIPPSHVSSTVRPVLLNLPGEPRASRTVYGFASSPQRMEGAETPPPAYSPPRGPCTPVDSPAELADPSPLGSIYELENTPISSSYFSDLPENTPSSQSFVESAGRDRTPSSLSTSSGYSRNRVLVSARYTSSPSPVPGCLRTGYLPAPGQNVRSPIPHCSRPGVSSSSTPSSGNITSRASDLHDSIATPASSGGTQDQTQLRDSDIYALPRHTSSSVSSIESGTGIAELDAVQTAREKAVYIHSEPRTSPIEQRSRKRDRVKRWISRGRAGR